MDPLEDLSARIRAGAPASPVDIERALEVGFGRLMGLEAELARARKRAAAEPAAAGEVDELQHRIAGLRDALVELRTLSNPAGPPRIGYGFVLPCRDPVRHAPTSHRSPGRPRPS